MEVLQTIQKIATQSPESVLFVSIIIAVILSMDNKKQRIPGIDTFYLSGAIALTGAGYYFLMTEGVSAIWAEVAKGLFLGTIVALFYKYVDVGEGLEG